MQIGTAGALAGVNDWLNQNVVPAGIAVGAVLASCGMMWAGLKGRRRLSWTIVYDGPINQVPQDKSKSEPRNDTHRWGVTYGDPNAAGSAERIITHGSLVILEVRNTGLAPIDKEDFTAKLAFRFPGRTVKDFKVRDLNSRTKSESGTTANYHNLIPRDPTTMPSARPDTIEVPELSINRRVGFRLVVLLDGEDKRVELAGGMLKFARPLPEHTRRSRRTAALALTAAAALVVGSTVTGIRLANSALTPTARCASGTLKIEGSSAFAPITTIAKNAYRQQCPNGAIAISPIGSSEGLAALQVAGTDTTRTIAMVDGSAAHSPGPGFTRTPVGVVIFAVVANASLNGSLNEAQIKTLFSGGPNPGGYLLIGRKAGSGTRDAFDNTVLGGPESALDKTTDCPPLAPGVVTKSCTVKTTMDLLAYVNATKNAIGYAEADALSFYPSVGVVPLNDRLPTREDSLKGGYPFVATENLYTSDSPADLTTDFVGFLKSDAMTARLHDNGYVACSEIAGTDLSGLCT